MGFLSSLFGKAKTPSMPRMLHGAHFIVAKTSIEQLDLSTVGSAIDFAEASSLRSGELEVIELAFHGYDDIALDLYQIPEVVRWMHHAIEARKDLVFWLSPGSLYLLLPCTTPGAWRKRPDGSIETSLAVNEITPRLHDCWMHTFLALKIRGATADTFKKL